MIPTQETNPNGLHSRYVVSKTSGEPVDPDAVYFVLRIDSKGDDPQHIGCCREAALAYAQEAMRHPHLYQLGRELAMLVARLELSQPVPIERQRKGET